MIVLFSNQKGGCGKTTNCIQFANYLVSQGKKVLVFDCDFQRSIFDRRQDDLKTFEVDSEMSVWDIESIDLEQLGAIVEEFKKVGRDTYILVDMPGKVDDEALFPLFYAADYIIVPYTYEKITLDSTGMFINLLDALKIKAPLLFLPNRIKKVVKYEDVEKTKAILSNFGAVLPEINDRVAMEKIFTLFINKEALEVVKPAYSALLDALE